MPNAVSLGESIPSSNCKPQGWPEGSYRVGPLGRLNVASKIRTPMGNEEFKNFKAISIGKPVEGSLWYHYARLTEGMLNRVEAAIRAHDPCLSCSTHAAGTMPLVIEMVDPEGKVIDRIARAQLSNARRAMNSDRGCTWRHTPSSPTFGQ